VRRGCRVVALGLVAVAACSALLGVAIAAAAEQTLVIPPPDYRPPETVQRVAVPVPPGDRERLVIVSGENSYEHDWTGVNNLLRRQLLETGRFDVRVLEEDGMLDERVLPFKRDELLKPLEQWFFGHR